MPIEAPSHGEDPSPGEPTRAWRPSLQPDYRAASERSAARNQIVERQFKRGLFSGIARRLGSPIVKIFIGVSLFIAAAIVFDATLNGGAWTEKPAKLKPTDHRGVSRAAPSD